MRAGWLVTAVGLVLAGCGASAPSGSGPPSTASVATTATTAPVATRPFTVGVATRTFVDRTRPTPAGSATPERPERTLDTTVYLPEGPGPFPLIVFSHGLNGHPDKFRELLGHWARGGYVVVAPAFPLTNDHVPGSGANARDLHQQPGDIVFVLDRVLAAVRTPGDPLEGKVDETRVGAGGLSLGGATTYALLYNPCCREPRFKVAEILSGAALPIDSDYDFRPPVPTLIMHGTLDGSLPYSAAVDAYGKLEPPKLFVSLLGGLHAPPFEDAPSPFDEVATTVTLDFWDAFLAGDVSAVDRLRRDADVAGQTQVQSALG